MDNDQLLHQILSVIDEFQGQDRVVLRVDKVCDFADHFVIVSGTSTKHVQSITEELALRCKHSGAQAFSIEGLEAGEWCLLDFGAVVVHIFVPEKRAHYNLEQLWAGAQRVSLEREA